MHSRLVPVLALVVGGCATLPPPTHVHAVGLGSTLDRPEVGIEGAISPMAGASASFSAPIPGAEVIAPEARVQGNLGSLGFTPGVWFRTGPGGEGVQFGTRVGGGLGVGDAFGAAPLRGAWAGPSLHLQLSGVAPVVRGGLTLGGEYLFATHESLGVDEDGNEIAMIDGLWVSLDGRVELGARDGAVRFVLGVGIHTWVGLIYIPQGTLGLRIAL